MDLSFPLKDHLESEEAYPQLLEASLLINRCKFNEGLEVLSKIAPAGLISNCIVSHRINKANFERGEYLKAYNGSESLI